MRILIANDRIGDPGGVRSYLRAVLPVLARRGHELALASCDGGRLGVDGEAAWRTFRVGGDAAGVDDCAAWQPDICVSHNMRDLVVDERLAAAAPVLKFMHGHYGTCVSGTKGHLLPGPAPCDRPFGAGCLALYYPRRCGSLRPQVFLASWQWTRRQRTLFGRYAAVMVASEHMRREYLSGGVAAPSVIVNPLFAPAGPAVAPAPVPRAPHVLFMARMNTGKGGGLLVDAVARASRLIGGRIRLTMMGDGPQRDAWWQRAAARGVDAHFTGWLEGDARWDVLRTASLVAIPGEWPETFGLVGLEAGALGVPAVAASAGGVTEWLRDGVNGVAVAPPPSASAFADAIARLLSDGALQARLRRGAQDVAQAMSLEAHVARLESALHRLVGSSLPTVMAR